MKKIMKYAYVVLAGVMAMAVTSCKDTYDYEGPGAQDPGAFLSVDATTLKYAADDAQILKLTLMRTNVGAVEDAILGGTTEQVTISVADESATVYGVKSATFTITRDFVWEYLGDGIYTSSFWGGAWAQPVYRGEGTQLYKLKDCIAKGYDITFELTDDGQHLLKPIEKQETGYVHPSYGMVYLEGAAADIQREGNLITLPMEYTVSAGSFGVKYDTIELP